MYSRIGCFIAIALLSLSIALSAQTGTSPQTGSASPQATKPVIKKVPAPYTLPSSGKDMYVAYCAACHGATGGGNGPAAPALKTSPTDLTQLAVKHGGTFPTEYVESVLEGREMVVAHGSKDMAVWGPIFKSMGERDTIEVLQRVQNLTSYVKSLQQK
jgi:mono/diheme cytochrome c family protein